PVPNGGALVINGQSRFEIPDAPSPPLASTFNHAVSSMLQNLEMRWGKIGRELRKFVRGLGKKTIEASSIERIPTGTQHFNRDHVNLGMSPITKMIVLSQSFSDIVEKRRRNYLFLLERLQGHSEPLFSRLPAGVSPLFYPLVVKEKSSVMQRLEEK